MSIDLGMPATRGGLYLDDEGRRISTNSMLKTFGRCPMQAKFKYDLRLLPKVQGIHLKRGVWVHELLEVLHGTEGTHDERVAAMWERHDQLSVKFDELFDEEKDHYGNMPVEIRVIVLGYIWHYRNDPWTVHEVERTLECQMPDGSIFRGKVDAIIEDQWGLWLADHKSHKRLPNHDFRVLDTQRPRYIKAAWENDIPVLGFIWNYVRWKAPTVPKLVYVGKKNQRLSTRDCETDYLTFKTALKQYRDENGLDPAPHMDYLKMLKGLQYRPGEPQRSPFFRRDVMESDKATIERVWKATVRSSTTMHEYDFSDIDAVPRVVDRSCEFSCSYTAPCTAQLIGANWELLARQNYKVADPNYYYEDKAGDNLQKEGD